MRKQTMHTDDKIALGCFGLWFGVCLVAMAVVAFVIIHFVAKVW